MGQKIFNNFMKEFSFQPRERKKERNERAGEGNHGKGEEGMV